MDGLPSVIPHDVAFGFALLGRRGARILGSLLKLSLSLPASTCCLNFLYGCFPGISCLKKKCCPFGEKEGMKEGLP